MPEKATLKRARAKLRHGDSPSTAAGEFIREEIHHIREGKHGARSTKQAIAIGLSKARRAGIPLEDSRAGTTKRAKAQARRDRRTAKHPHEPDPRRSRAMKKALKKEPRRAASKTALSRHAKKTSKRALATRRRHERTGAIRKPRAAARTTTAKKATTRRSTKRTARASATKKTTARKTTTRKAR